MHLSSSSSPSLYSSPSPSSYSYISSSSSLSAAAPRSREKPLRGLRAAAADRAHGRNRCFRGGLRDIDVAALAVGALSGVPNDGDVHAYLVPWRRREISCGGGTKPETEPAAAESASPALAAVWKRMMSPGFVSCGFAWAELKYSRQDGKAPPGSAAEFRNTRVGVIKRAHACGNRMGHVKTQLQQVTSLFSIMCTIDGVEMDFGDDDDAVRALDSVEVISACPRDHEIGEF